MLDDVADISLVSQDAAMIREWCQKLYTLEDGTGVYRSIRKKMWNLAPQLGVPSFLLKVKSPTHALGMYLTTDTPERNWMCSFCVDRELDIRQNCEHGLVISKCIERIGEILGCSVDYLMGALIRHAQFVYRTHEEFVCFYGDVRKTEFAVVAEGFKVSDSGMPYASQLHIVRNAKNWVCLARSCHGICSSCSHSQIVRNLTTNVTRSHTPCMYAEALDVQEFTRHGSTPAIEQPRYPRPMIPSSRAFDVDMQVNIDSCFGIERWIPPAKKCHCGCMIGETDDVQPFYVASVRVEGSRCIANYKQGTWKCKNRHFVLPRDDVHTRDGFIWLSKDTVYTEVFLFDVLLHVTFSGASISSQAHIRSQLLSLQINVTNSTKLPRSSISFRNALSSFAMSVVMGMPDWVFRCDKCALVTDNGVYYDKLSFDGQQLGFNIRQKVRHDFYEKNVALWARPVERCANAWMVSHTAWAF